MLNYYDLCKTNEDSNFHTNQVIRKSLLGFIYQFYQFMPILTLLERSVLPSILGIGSTSSLDKRTAGNILELLAQQFSMEVK